MRVGDLQEKLSKLDPNLELLCYSEDEALQSSGHFFRLFDVEDVSLGEGVLLQGTDGTKSMRFERSEDSREVAFLNITTDF